MRFNFAVLAVNLLIVSNIVCIESNIALVKSEKEFDQLFQATSKLLVAQFHSGCPVCNSTRKHLQKIALEYSNVRFVEVDINSLPKLAQRYNIAALPTVLIFEPGDISPKHTIVGPDREMLISKINETLQTLEKK